MKKMRIVGLPCLLMFFSLIYFSSQAQQTSSIVIEGEVPGFLKPRKAYLGNAFEMALMQIGLSSLYPEFEVQTSKVVGGKVKWTYHVSFPAVLVSDYLSPDAKGLNSFLISPGDSININYDRGQWTYSGIGWEKFKLQHEIDLLKIKFPRPTKYNELSLESVDDYFVLNKYYDSLLKLVVPLVDSYKNKIRESEYNWIKIHEIERIEEKRLHAFIRIVNNEFSLKPKELIAIWDTTQFKPWAMWLRGQSDYHNGESPYYHYNFNRMDVYRQFGFDFTNDTIKSETAIFKYLTYYNAKQNYKNIIRERVMAFILDEQTITELGPHHPVAVKMLTDYYRQPGFKEYKKLVYNLETKAKELRSNLGVPRFELKNAQGESFTKEDLKGKIVLIDFWFTGCKPCLQMARSLQAIEDVLRSDTNVVFISISIDAAKGMWLKSVEGGQYTTPQSIKLYTGGQGMNHPMIKAFNVTGYPELFLLDENSIVIKHPVPDPRTDSGKEELIYLIKNASAKKSMKEIAGKCDGPYAFHDGTHLVIEYIDQINGKPTLQSLKKDKNDIKNLSFDVSTDIPSKRFVVNLKPGLANEPCVFSTVCKQLAFSDIEGNFDAFRKLLLAGKVIDSNFNWIFGNGHLILIGDMFDRGNQVTECLWLIYSLEEKAKAAGGYVHFILGNHEIMNLRGDHGYVEKKYKDNSKLMNKSLAQLYNEKSELGRWLRTKNIIEIIGGILYTHGGISPQVNRLPLTIGEINDLVRSNIDKKIDSSNYSLLVLFDNQKIRSVRDATSPFWFRGYYGDWDNIYAIPTFEQVDSTFQKFGINRIVTGHTIVGYGDAVTSHYEGKIINTDTHHAEGKSEGLLIENGNFYRINDRGNRILLFDGSKKTIKLDF